MKSSKIPETGPIKEAGDWFGSLDKKNRERIHKNVPLLDCFQPLSSINDYAYRRSSLGILQDKRCKPMDYLQSFDIMGPQPCLVCEIEIVANFK